MRLSKFFSVIIFITSISLLYIYQQTEVLHLAYVSGKKQAIMEDLLDKNTILRYNIKRNASLTRIGNKIAGDADFQMPDTYQLVRLSPSRETFKFKGQAANKQTILSRFFGIKQQAEAKTINP